MATSYTFYQATLPQLRGIAKSAISFLTVAKDEISKDSSKLPSEQEILDLKFGDMLPFRMQPILVAKFQADSITSLKLNGSAAAPTMDPSSFSSLDDVINLFKQMLALFDAVDEKAYNESAKKDLTVEIAGKSLHVSSLEAHMNEFVIPNSYFHLNAMYMLLRSKGFALGKPTYVGPFMSETTQKDWQALRA